MCSYGLCIFLLTVFPAGIAFAQPYIAPETIISDDITYVIHWDGSYSFEEDLAIRLNTAEAVQDNGQAYISYSASVDTPAILDAYTQTADGSRLDVLPDEIIDQGGAGNNASFGDEREKVIIFPALAPGAVEHYHYKIDTNAADFPGQFYAEQNFDVDAQTLSATVTVLAPSNLKLFFEADGMTGGAQPSAPPGQDKFYYSLRGIAAAIPEQGAVGTDDYSPRLLISSFPDYPSVGAAYEQRAAAMARVTPKVQRLADTITRNITAPRAQAEALYDWVSREIRYVAVDIGNSGFVPNADDQIIDSGLGDCKDHVILLEALLAAKHIPSSGVLVNWNNEYFAPRIAVPSFNHIITYIPQFNLFADSTAQFAPFGVLPSLERGKQALITGAQGIAPRLVVLPLTSAPIPDQARMVTNATLQPDGTVIGSSIVTDSGRYELSDREHFAAIAPGTVAQAAASLMDRYGVQGNGTLAAGDPRDLSKAFQYTTQFSMPFYAGLPGPGSLPIPLGVPAFSALASLMKYAALPSRAQATPCLPADTEEVTLLSLPPGLHVKSLPPPEIFKNAMGAYTASYTKTGNAIRADRHLVLNPPSATCGPAQYQLIRSISFVLGRDFRATISY